MGKGVTEKENIKSEGFMINKMQFFVCFSVLFLSFCNNSPTTSNNVIQPKLKDVIIGCWDGQFFSNPTTIPSIVDSSYLLWIYTIRPDSITSFGRLLQFKFGISDSIIVISNSPHTYIIDSYSYKNDSITLQCNNSCIILNKNSILESNIRKIDSLKLTGYWKSSVLKTYDSLNNLAYTIIDTLSFYQFLYTGRCYANYSWVDPTQICTTFVMIQEDTLCFSSNESKPLKTSYSINDSNLTVKVPIIIDNVIRAYYENYYTRSR